MDDEKEESARKRQVTSFGKAVNPLVSFIETMHDDDAAVIDELGVVDATAEAMKLTV